MKLTNNTKKLLVILILMLSLVVTMFGIGILTRDSTSVVSTTSNVKFFKSTLHKPITEWLLNQSKTIVKINSEIQAVFTKYILEQNRKDIIAALKSEVIYVNYAYEIAKFRYPAIDPEYVCAIIYHESRFDPTVTNSKTGVRGLTQISPKWHAKRAESLGVMDLYEPYGNILVCFDILNELTQKYDFEYALNFYAGGYPYANNYRDSKSPFIEQLQEIISEHDFSEQVLPYSITENGGVLNGES